MSRGDKSALASLVDAGGSEVRKHKARAWSDFAYFCMQYLSHLFFAPFAPYQQEILRMVTERKLTHESAKVLRSYMRDGRTIPAVDAVRGIVNIEPRGHGKTVRMCLALPLWLALTGRSKFIVIIAANQMAAARLNDDIRWEAESNEVLLRDFGALAGATWSTSELHFTNDVCIRFAGAGTAIRGVRYRQHRPDLILIDDLMTDGTAASALEREKKYLWFKRAIIPMAKDALIVTTGTVMHNNDVVSRLSKEITTGAMPWWVNVRFSALRPHPRRKGVELALWPEHWDVEALRVKKREIGSHNFATEYQNEPLAPEDALVRTQWIEEHASSAFDVASAKMFAAVDPSAGKHDQSAIVVVARLSDGRIVVLDAWGKCCTPSVLVTRLISMYHTWRMVRIAFEAVGFQSIYKKYIEERARSEGVRLPIVAVQPKGGGKQARVERMSPYFENGTYFFATTPRCAELKEQLTLFPKHEYDDQVDALAYATELAEGRNAHAPAVFGLGTQRHVARLFGR